MEIEKAAYMVPVPIADGPADRVIPRWNLEIIKGIKNYVVENIRTARRMLKRMVPEIEIDGLTFYELNGHTPENEIRGYLEPLRKGEPLGIMSEAGCPGVADPGARIVELAQEEGFKVVPLVGPSSILLSLMASGLNGQKFTFQGYLPVKDDERLKAIRGLEQESGRTGVTQIFIETPYRNEKMLESLLKNLHNDTKLCVASDITAFEKEFIETHTVGEWKKKSFKLEKVPTIFLFNSHS